VWEGLTHCAHTCHLPVSRDCGLSLRLESRYTAGETHTQQVVHAGRTATDTLRTAPTAPRRHLQRLVAASPATRGASRRLGSRRQMRLENVSERWRTERMGWVGCTQFKAYARAYRTPVAMPYVHITDFSTDPTSTARPLATGSHRYMVVLNYDLPRTTPHLWNQGAFSPEARGRTRQDTHCADRV
jgi:hypothetical protein